MKKKEKLKMSNRRFRGILIPVMSIVGVLAVVATVAANMMSSTLDTYLGKGQGHVIQKEGVEDWDTEYYKENSKNSEESKTKAYEVSKKVSNEGSILLKNNGVLPLAKGSTVTPFGRAYLSPIYGQLSSGGSAKWVVDPVTPEQGLSAFKINNTAVDVMKANDYETIIEAPGTKEAGKADTVLGGDCKMYEYNPNIYSSISGVGNTTGMVFITRSGQEGQDQKYDGYADGTPHYLALNSYEKEAIKTAKQKCGKVVVVLVTSATMELGPLMSGEYEADAILYIGHPGEKGFNTLSDLLDGDVNPSGRTPDTYVRDLTKDPSYCQIGVKTYSNEKAAKPGFVGGDLGDSYDRMFTEYQEGVYMGYRYYETAASVDPSFKYGTLDDQGKVVEEGSVIYPFGYGLSYTTFTQKITSFDVQDYDINVSVEVKNTGTRAGKDVVELYYSGEYTDFDKQNKIEKPSTNLIAFDKTEILNPGETQTVELTFTKDDITNYFYGHKNPDGTSGCYILEGGTYIVALKKNSHETIEKRTFDIKDTIFYDGSDDNHIRRTDREAQSALKDDGTPENFPAEAEKDTSAKYVAATNQFEISSQYMNENSTILSRSNWSQTQPSMPASGQKTLNDNFKQYLNYEINFDVENDPKLGNASTSIWYSEKEPTSKQNNGLTLADMRGKSYYDSNWDLLLDQIDWDKDKEGILLSFSGAAYTLGQITSIGLPKTVQEDGANGLKVQGADNGYDMSKSSSFGFAPLMAATWNKKLLHEIGNAFGQELIQNGINGWYCPAINLHRSQFNGRVFEYYSEDPVLSGKLASEVISGAGDSGMTCYVKHFALNDTDTGRDQLSNFWADEQTMREIYMKPFEIAIKEAKTTIKYTADNNGNTKTKVIRAATGVMPAQNCIGTTMGHVNYNLLTNVLRKEWGFQGMVISDYWVWGKNNIRDLAIRSGCDAYLCMNVPSLWTLEDYTSPSSRNAMRNAIHNIGYTVANSNAMQKVAPGSFFSYDMSPWESWLIIADVLIIVLEIGGIVWIVLRSKKAKKHPELYKNSKIV